jgi:hypothetical protein
MYLRLGLNLRVRAIVGREKVKYVVFNESIPWRRHTSLIAMSSQVPSIPWSGSFGGPEDGPLVAELNEEGLIPDEIFRKAQVTTVEEALSAVSATKFKTNR